MTVNLDGTATGVLLLMPLMENKILYIITRTWQLCAGIQYLFLLLQFLNVSIQEVLIAF